MAIERWTDDRLDDRFTAVDDTLRRHDRELQRVVENAGRLIALEGSLGEVQDDAHACREGVEQLRSAIRDIEAAREAARVSALEQREVERKAAVEERKSDRRFIIQAVLAASAIIVTAVGILISVLA